MPRLPSRLPRASTLLLLVVLVLGFVLGAVWLMAAQHHAETSRDALQKLQQQSSRVAHLDSLLVHLLDAESGVRGFILTGAPAHLAPYRDGSADIDITLAALRAESWPDAAQRDTVEQLATRVETRWALLARAIERSAGPETDDGTESGKQITHDIRALIETLRSQTMEQIHDTILASFDNLGDARRTNTVLGMGVLVLLATIIVLLYRQDRLRERLEMLLQSENERLQSVVEMRTAALSNLATYLTNTREAEKERLARELHDELSQGITAVRAIAGAIQQRSADQPGIHGNAQVILAMTGQMQDGVRTILERLRQPSPEAPKTVGAILDEACKQWSRLYPHIALDCRIAADEPVLANEQTHALQRLLQESLTNVARHAQANAVSVVLDWNAQAVTLSITDNGRGLCAIPADARPRYGLVGMQERVRALGGTLRLERPAAGGCRVEASLPLALPAVPASPSFSSFPVGAMR